MQPLWTVAEVLAATGGRAHELSEGPLNSVSIDSREIEPAALFVAIKGETHDGHDFVGKAIAAGAAAAIVSEEFFAKSGGHRLIIVPDPFEALRQLAVAARARNKGFVVAVTGSAGKTTTKEAIRTVLSAFGMAHSSVKSFNNHWGVPLTLARFPRDAQFGVFEIGMNHAGEITPLVRMVRPHVSVITTVAAAHLEFFESVAGIAKAKAEIFLGLEPGGTALLNADHEYVHLLFGYAREAEVARVVTYGYEQDADWQIGAVAASDGATRTRIRHGIESFDLRLNVPGEHMVANATAALVVARLAGESTSKALEALHEFAAPEGRGLTLRFGPADTPLVLVDESYNANIASMNAALSLYAPVVAPGGTKRLVLGDMLELGPQGPALAAGLADPVLATGARQIVLVGPVMAALGAALRARIPQGTPGPEIIEAPTVEQISDKFLAELAYGDAVMVKGSKGVRLAQLVAAIRTRFEPA
jgi:UDP-N-acetylmuramoyl-tripeptide--D-alanyl-D-alanine ligase